MTAPVEDATVAAPIVASRLHPRGILARSWPALAIAAVYLNQRRGDGFLTVKEIVGGIGVIVAVTLVVQALAWRVTTFSVDRSALSLRSGLLVRQSRQLLLERLQSVDVVRPLAARVLGLSELRVEVAGSGSSRVQLRYLSRSDADALRVRILALAHGGAPAPDMPVAEAPFYAVPNGMAGKAYLLTHPLVALAIPAGLILWQLGVIAAAAFGGLAAVGLSILQSVRTATGWANFSLAEGPDGLHMRRGLVDTRAQTVAPGRVSAVSIVQPPLWRLPGWVRVEVTIAGYGHADEHDSPGMLLPVAPLHVATALLWRLFPQVDLSAFALRPIPRRARWRAPFVGRAYGSAVVGDVFVTRYGVLTRHTSFVAAPRVQSVHLTQGPWQRWLRLATTHVDIAPGPVKAVARHLDAGDAAALAHRLADLARHATP